MMNGETLSRHACTASVARGLLAALSLLALGVRCGGTPLPETVPADDASNAGLAGDAGSDELSSSGRGVPAGTGGAGNDSSGGTTGAGGAGSGGVAGAAGE